MRRSRTLIMRLRDERGVAMIVAILTTVVVIALGLVAVELATHNVTASAYDRKRVQAVAAAEAGIDAVMEQLQVSPPASLPCTDSQSLFLPAVTVPITPAAEYQVSVQYYDASGNRLSCSAVHGLSNPARISSAYVTSTGTAVATGTVGQVERTLYTQVTITPNNGFKEAIFSNGSFTTQNNFTVGGNNGNDGNVYTNGDFTCTNNSTIHGSVYVAGLVSGTTGAATVGQASGGNGGACTIQGTLWTKGSISMANNSTVVGNVLSSGGSLQISNPATIGQSVQVNGSCTYGGSACAAPSAYIGGNLTTGANVPNPPAFTFPAFPWGSSWTNPRTNQTYQDEQAAFASPPGLQTGQLGYDESSYANLSCSSALTALGNGVVAASGYNGVVVRVSQGPCNLDFASVPTKGNQPITISTNTAIVLDGSMSASKNVTFQGTQGACASQNAALGVSTPNNNCVLSLIVPSTDVPGFEQDGATACPTQYATGGANAGTYDLSFQNLVSFNNLIVFLYTPCNVNFSNNNETLQGEVYGGGTVNVANLFTLGYFPVPFPVAGGDTTGYSVSPVFLREVPVVQPTPSP